MEPGCAAQQVGDCGPPENQLAGGGGSGWTQMRDQDVTGLAPCRN